MSQSPRQTDLPAVTAVATVAAGLKTSASSLKTMGTAMPKVASGAPGAAAGLAAVAAAAVAAVPGLLAGTPALAAFAATCGTAASAALVLAASIASVGANVRSSMSSASSAVSGFGSKSTSAFRTFATSARTAASAARLAIMGACRQMSAQVGSLRLTLPRIQVGALPHFSMSGKFDAQSGSVPSVRVNWYASGGVFSSPSVIGVGEAGDEAVLPLRPSVLRGIGEGIGSTGGDSSEVIEWLDRNLPAIIQRYTPVTLERDLDRHIRAVAHA